MPLRSLFESGYDAYVEENRDRDNLWFFIHIPKTAGSSFRAELATILSPEHNIHVYDDASNRPHVKKLEAALNTFRLKTEATSYRFVSGHVFTDMVGSLLDEQRRIKLFTILRDPVRRFISDYRYQSTAQHPDYVQFRRRFPNIEAYLDDPSEANKMWTYLRPSPNATVEETVEYLLDHFAFVGLLEMYPLSFRIIMTLLNEKREPSLYLRRTSDEAENAVHLTPELNAKIRDYNSKDIELYRRFAELLRPLRHVLFPGTS